MAWSSTHHDEREISRIASGNIGVDDVVRHIAAKCSDSGVAIPTNMREWYLLFAGIRGDPNAPMPIKQLYFDRDRASQELVETIHSLTTGRNLLLVGERFDRYEVPEANKRKWLEQLMEAPEEYKMFLEESYKAAKRIFPSIELRVGTPAI